MMKLVFAATSVLALVAGCTAPTSSSDTASSSQALRHRAADAVVVGEGEHCGGNIQDAPVCDTGLKCVLGNPDVGGTCQYAAAGESCGGFIRTAVQCGSGLVCSHVDANGNVTNPDGPGVCVSADSIPTTSPKVAEENEHCGGNINNAPVCDTGLKCVLGRIPDAGGTCQYASEGDSCGGNMSTAVQCGAGLDCSHVDANGNLTNPDLPGVCVSSWN